MKHPLFLTAGRWCHQDHQVGSPPWMSDCCAELVQKIRGNDEDYLLLAMRILKQAQHGGGEHIALGEILLVAFSNEFFHLIERDDCLTVSLRTR